MTSPPFTFDDPPAAAGRLKAVCALDLLKKEIKPKEVILGPWLRERDLAMIHAYRGVGKTYLSLTTALAIAAGGKFMCWEAPRPRRVLMLDGEMSEASLQKRTQALLNAHKWNLEPDALKIISQGAQDSYIRNLCTPEGQGDVAEHLDGVDLLVIDNISTLAYGGTENDADSWSAMQEWLIALRKAGKAVLLIHHSGKGGQQRGTSRREDILDVVLGLKRPTDYAPADGAKFEIHFEKARDLMGDDVKTMVAHLHNGEASAMWTHKSADESRDERILELNEAGLSQRDIADEVGVSKSTVNRIIKNQ